MKPNEPDTLEYWSDANLTHSVWRKLTVELEYLSMAGTVTVQEKQKESYKLHVNRFMTSVPALWAGGNRFIHTGRLGILTFRTAVREILGDELDPLEDLAHDNYHLVNLGIDKVQLQQCSAFKEIPQLSNARAVLYERTQYPHPTMKEKVYHPSQVEKNPGHGRGRDILAAVIESLLCFPLDVLGYHCFHMEDGHLHEAGLLSRCLHVEQLLQLRHLYHGLHVACS